MFTFVWLVTGLRKSWSRWAWARRANSSSPGSYPGECVTNVWSVIRPKMKSLSMQSQGLVLGLIISRVVRECATLAFWLMVGK